MAFWHLWRIGLEIIRLSRQSRQFLQRLTLVPGKVPSLDGWLRSAKELGSVASTSSRADLFNRELEVGVWGSADGLGAVLRSVNFKTNVKVLSGQEINLVWWEDATESRATTQTLEGLRRGKAGQSGQSHSRLDSYHDDECMRN